LRGFSDISIRRKLALMIMTTCGTALLLAGVSILLYELIISSRAVGQNLSSLAAVVGSGSAAALAFDDRRAAQETLGALRAKPNVVWAYIYRKDGSVFAGYSRDGATASPRPCTMEVESYRSVDSGVELCRRIELRHETLGAIHLRSDLGEAHTRLWGYVQIILVVMLLSFFVALTISSGLQRFVSEPILSLAEIARTVSLEQNYSIRATTNNKDEIGVLVDGFNQMLGQIQKRDAELQQTHTELEKRVQELQHEVAERRRAEESLANKTAELQRSNRELEQFAYVASHDLQEPLRMVTGYSQLLARRYRDKLDQTAQEYIGFAVDGARRMQRLIQDLLTYSRVGTRGKAFAAADCEAILATTLTGLQVAIKESGAIITHDPLPTVTCDEGQIGQLFQNLIGNGIKYRNSKAPEVHLSCEREGKDWLFSVRDNGIGIDPQHAERIFVIFQRLHTSEEFEGTGIGLAVCKKIVERHGGRIWVESELGKGATFYFSLPAEEPFIGAGKSK